MFYLMLDSAIINVSFRIFLYVKLKVGHHHFLLTTLTEMHSSKLLTIILSIIDHK